MSFSCEASFPASHPVFSGHFPDNPVVPGVLLLDQVRLALQQWQPGAVIDTIRQVKFIKPILPTQPFKIYLASTKPNDCAFHCELKGVTVAKGAFTFVAAQ